MQLRRKVTAIVAFGCGADECLAHAFDNGAQRRKIDRDFVVEPVAAPRQRVGEHTFRLPAVVARTNREILHDTRTIGAGSSLVKAAEPAADELSRRKTSVSITNKMEPKECPMCGEHMRLQTRDETSRVPGSRETRTKQITEWVCPECDYFEEA